MIEQSFDYSLYFTPLNPPLPPLPIIWLPEPLKTLGSLPVSSPRPVARLQPIRAAYCGLWTNESEARWCSRPYADADQVAPALWPSSGSQLDRGLRGVDIFWDTYRDFSDFN